MKLLTTIALGLNLAATPGPAGQLGYPEIQTDAQGKLVPWCSPTQSQACDHVVNAVWNFRKTMGTCSNGLPCFFQHQVWKPEHDPRGLGGDQLAMALSSLNLLYDHSGHPAARQMMVRIAAHYLEHSTEGPVVIRQARLHQLGVAPRRLHRPDRGRHLLSKPPDSPPGLCCPTKHVLKVGRINPATLPRVCPGRPMCGRGCPEPIGSCAVPHPQIPGRPTASQDRSHARA